MGAVHGDVSYSIFAAVERERLAQEVLDMRQGTESVMEITRMFTERAMFCLEFDSEQDQMTRYFEHAQNGYQAVCFHLAV